MVLGAFVYNLSRDHTLSLDELREQGSIMLPKPRALADIDLQTATGAPYTEANLIGAWSFLFFGFTNCPDICPITLSIMGQAQLELSAEEKADFRGVLVSVDPERDDPATLATYVQAFSSDFIGLTGSIEQIANFATQVNAAFQKYPGRGGELYEMDHTGNIVIINPRGHYHGFIKLPHARDKLLATFRSLRANF